MIKRIAIKGFRGIFQASFKDLNKINVFVGRNNTGKSTILEAIYLYSTNAGVDFFGRFSIPRVLVRRGYSPKFFKEFSKYLFFRGIAINPIVINDLEIQLIENPGKIPPELEKNCLAFKISKNGKPNWILFVDWELRVQISQIGEENVKISNTIFVDDTIISNLEDLYSLYKYLLKSAGYRGKEAILNAARLMLGEIQSIEPLEEGLLYVTFRDHSVPITNLGDGFKKTISIFSFILLQRGGILILEEPENHLNPTYMDILADVLVKASRENKNQIFLSTHSNEFLKKILERGYDETKVFALQSLIDGKINYIEYSGSEALDMIETLGRDIRL